MQNLSFAIDAQKSRTETEPNVQQQQRSVSASKRSVSVISKLPKSGAATIRVVQGDYGLGQKNDHH